MTDPEESPAPTGPQEGRCGAIRGRDADGNPNRWCRKYPVRGSNRCERDGAGAPQVKAAAERRQQEAAALAVVARYGVPQHIDWHVAMQESLDETYGNVLALRDLVARLTPGALVWGTTQEVTVGATQFPGIDTTQAAGIAPTVELYGRERDRLFRMAHDCGKLGLEVRRQSIDEAAGKEWGERIAQVMRESLTELARMLAAGEITTVDPSQPAVTRVVSARLRAVGA